MDAWSDEGRVYLLEVGPALALAETSEQVEDSNADGPDSRLLMVDATSILLERGRFEAAAALHACRLELEIGGPAPFANVPVRVRLKAPADLAFSLQDLERDLAWFVREAIAEALPAGYEIAELVVQAQAPYYGDEHRQVA
jgi:hypothetical protein